MFVDVIVNVVVTSSLHLFFASLLQSAYPAKAQYFSSRFELFIFSP